MDFKDLAVTMFVVLVAIFGTLSLVNQFNEDYGMTGGSQFNNTLTRINLLNESSAFSLELGNTSVTDSGSSSETGTTALVGKALTGLTKIPTFLGLAPAVLRDLLSVIGIPDPYPDIASYLFVIVFAITMIYVLLLGVRRLTG